MSDWHIAMLAILPLTVWARPRRSVRVRVWLAMMIASGAAYIYPSIWAFVAIDLIAAVIVLIPPRNLWQKIIGGLFLVMAFIEIGYAGSVVSYLYNFSSAQPDPTLLRQTNIVIGWAALSVLFIFSGDDWLGSSGLATGDLRSQEGGNVGLEK